jgi:hypothetical protein
MKPARFIASGRPRQAGSAPHLLRRLIASIPARWRGVVMLTTFTILFPLWITAVICEALMADDSIAVPQVESAPEH